MLKKYVYTLKNTHCQMLLDVYSLNLGYEELFDLFVEKGANIINASDKKGNTPLLVAANGKYTTHLNVDTHLVLMFSFWI